MTAPVIESPVMDVTVRSEGSAVAAQPPGLSMTDLIKHALDINTPVESLERLVALHERVSQQQAERDYFAAMARFQADCPSIKKNSSASFATDGGSKMSYKYSELDAIAAVVNPLLDKNGLSYTWNTKVEGGQLVCACTVRHVNGHHTTSAIALPTESRAAMSAQQKVGAAYTFARRLSLIGALGLTTTEDDLDGRDDATGKINDDQVTVLTDLLREAKVKPDSLLKMFKVAALTDIPANRYDAAVQALETKKAAKKAGQP